MANLKAHFSEFRGKYKSELRPNSSGHPLAGPTLPTMASWIQLCTMTHGIISNTTGRAHVHVEFSKHQKRLCGA